MYLGNAELVGHVLTCILLATVVHSRYIPIGRTRKGGSQKGHFCVTPHAWYMFRMFMNVLTVRIGFHGGEVERAEERPRCSPAAYWSLGAITGVWIGDES